MNFRFCRFSLALFLLLTPFTRAQKYEIVDLGTMSPVAINVWGQVAGNLNHHAVVWANNHIHNLGVLPGGTFTTAGAINDLGVVAGSGDGPGTLTSTDPNVAPVSCSHLVQPFRWSLLKGFTALSSFPAASSDILKLGIDACFQETHATGVNLFEQVTATTDEIDSFVDPYLWDPRTGAKLEEFDFQDSANAINDFGIVVGAGGVLSPGQFSAAIVLKNNARTFLPVLNMDDGCSGANSINDFGKIAGWAEILPSSTAFEMSCDAVQFDNVPIHAVLWPKSTSAPKDLGTLPGDQLSMAIKVNPLGVVIGMSGNSLAQSFAYPFQQVVGRPFIWDAVHGMRDLNDLLPFNSGWTLQSVSDISGVGLIVGTGTVDGQTHGFLLKPRLF